jgi:hypothetical protein
MEGFSNKIEQGQQNVIGAVDVVTSPSTVGAAATASVGSSVQTSDFENALNQSVQPADPTHTAGAGLSAFHVALDNVSSLRNLDTTKVQKEFSLKEDVGFKGDLLDPGAGNNIATGSNDSDVVLANKGGSNIITTGAGKDSIILGAETTNQITDFNLATDRLILDSNVNVNNIVIAQGKNTTEGALDSSKNTLIIDKAEGHILGSLTNVDASALTGVEGKGILRQLDGQTLTNLSKVTFANAQEGDGQLTGSVGRDKLVGRAGNDILNGDPAVISPASTPLSNVPTGDGSVTPPITPPPGDSTGGGLPVTPPITPPVDNTHDHTGAGASSANHVALDQVDVLRSLDLTKLRKEVTLSNDIGLKGDLVVTGAGKNVVIGTGQRDVIDTRGGGFNTITTGGGQDSIILDGNTTNRILDFDPTKDRLLFTQGMDLNNIVVAQGKNPGKGGVKQPLDSVNNALILDKTDGHILASLAFTKASALQGLEESVRKGFSLLNDQIFDTLKGVQFNTTQEGDGQLTGTRGRDKLVGHGGDDFFYVGNDGFKIVNAVGTGPTEVPFSNDSPGSTEALATLKDGVLSVKGSYKNFDAAPIFSTAQEQEGRKIGTAAFVDPLARAINDNDPRKATKADVVLENFKKVQNDIEGNPLSGSHLHFSPSEDVRGNFADATVVRYFTNTAIDAKSGTIAGNFKLDAEEQAAFLAGDLYLNIHTNVDVDGDGRGGFITGENRVNFNQNVVKLLA